MSRSYREDYTEHQIKAFNAQKNNTRNSKVSFNTDEEDGLSCPVCKKFCTYTYLARNSQCHNCNHEISLDD